MATQQQTKIEFNTPNVATLPKLASNPTVVTNENTDGIYKDKTLKIVEAVDNKNANVLSWTNVVEYLQEYHKTLPSELGFIAGTRVGPSWEDIYKRVCLYTKSRNNSNMEDLTLHNKYNEQAYNSYTPINKVFVLYILVHVVCKLFLQLDAKPPQSTHEIKNINIYDKIVLVSNENIVSTIRILFNEYPEDLKIIEERTKYISQIYLDALVLFIIREILSTTTLKRTYQDITNNAIMKWQNVIYKYTHPSCTFPLLRDVLLQHNINVQYPKGLVNPFSNCYMNSMVQCLNAVPELVSWAMQQPPPPPPPPINEGHGGPSPSNVQLLLAQQYVALVKEMWANDGDNTCNPKDFVEFLSNSNLFEKDTHHDSSEFMGTLFDALTTFTNLVEHPVKTDEWIELTSTNLLTLADREEEIRRSQVVSVIDDIFGMVQVKQKKCSNIHTLNNYTPTYKFEYNNYHSLGFPSSETPTVQFTHLLDNYFGYEKIDEATCDFCKEKGNVSIINNVYKLPRVLILILARYTAASDRIDVPISIPNELDVSPYCAENVEHRFGTKYELISVSHHTGTTESGIHRGHYTADAMSPVNKRWYSFNDDVRNEIDSLPSSSNTAYVLFYRLKGICNEE